MKLPWLAPLVFLVMACSVFSSTPTRRVEAACVACMEGCEALPPRCGFGQVQVFGAPGLELHGCRRDGEQPWGKTVEWCCDRAPVECVAGVAAGRRGGVWRASGS